MGGQDQRMGRQTNKQDRNDQRQTQQGTQYIVTMGNAPSPPHDALFPMTCALKQFKGSQTIVKYVRVVTLRYCH